MRWFYSGVREIYHKYDILHHKYSRNKEAETYSTRGKRLFLVK